jgi:deoxyribodipyrimidine photo-lyase
MEVPFEDPDLSQLKYLSGIELKQNNEARVHLAAEILQDHQDFQRGGELEGRTWLKSFIRERSNKYAQTISLPEESRFHNSRLSPYLSWGNLSVRQVHQTFKKHVVSDHPNRFGIRACHQRLIWRSHFVQKFESECRMEFENINSAYNRLDRAHDAALLERWKEGVTGFPLVDASMRCVNATGWLNFRMRAMVISFLTHYLWQHWREGAVWLGSRFLDFEPGIHYPQVQMQAASTGIHTVRVYNPIKQAKEKDPDGVFIRRWVPELAALPTQYVHQPSAAPPLELAFQNIELGKDYPLPMVEAKIAHKKATDALWEIKNNAETRREGRKIMKKHVKPGRRWQ